MPNKWSFLTNHARVLLLIASNRDARLRDIASAIDVTERTAYAIVFDLAEAGYVVKERDGRRNRYHIQEHLPLPTDGGGKPTIGELLGLLRDAEIGPSPSSRM
ncbi:MAG: AsnC family transcriptional regulator [Acidimicrobiia bacterium]